MGNIPPSELRRQPPPPRRCSGSSPRSGIEDSRSNKVLALTTSEEEGNISTVGSYMSPRNRRYYSRRCKKGDSATNINSLPEELLLEILVRVPAEDIHENSRLVCRRWYRIIQSDGFVQSHLQHTSPGLLLAESWGGPTIFVTATVRCGIEISKSSYGSGFHVLGSCNGLIMGMDMSRKDAPCIVNPATKARFDLPPLSDAICGPEGCVKRYGIAYVAASMEYKVFAICFPNPHDPMIIQCAILTVGVDNAWRNVVIEQLSAKAKHLLREDLLITEGFMHWTLNGYRKCILSMNVETETITEIPYPASLPDNRYKRRYYYYLSNGRHLSVLIRCKDLVWEFWEIRGETLECGKLVKKIDMRAHKSRISQTRGESLMPLGWVKYPSVLALSFRSTCHCFVYNLDTGEIDSFELSLPSHYYVAAVHRSSLVWSS